MNNIYVLKTDKFKSNAICITMPLPLDEKVTEYNLIAAILKRGCEKFSSTKEIEKHLEYLYGAAFDIAVSKKGEILFLNFFISIVDNRFINYDENLFEEGIKFLNEIINHSLIQNGKFNNEYFEQERKNLKILIESRIDNKDQYAIEKAIELCFYDEPYSIYQYGDVEQLNKIDNCELVNLWNSILEKNVTYFFVSCNLEEEFIQKIIEQHFNIDCKAIKAESKINYKEVILKEVTEKMKVNQGKISMAFKTNTNILEGDYFALIVMNSILGGGTHSKLFSEVREKNSLAYYCYSFIEKFKGVLVIAAGVEVNNFKKAGEIIIAEIEKIQNGIISDKELQNSKTKLKNDLRSIEDIQFTLIEYLGSLRVYGINYSIDDLIDEIEKVTIDRIAECSKKLKLGIIYYIESEEEKINVK